jgi:hypothetical protein
MRAGFSDQAIAAATAPGLSAVLPAPLAHLEMVPARSVFGWRCCCQSLSSPRLLFI